MWRRVARSVVALAVLCVPVACHSDHDARSEHDAAASDAARDAEPAPQEAGDASVSLEPATDAVPQPCVRRDPSIQVEAETDDAVSAATPIAYTVSITNQNDASCPPETFILSATTPAEVAGLRSEPGSLRSQPLAAGETVSLSIVITSDPDQEAGTYPLGFFARSELREVSVSVLSAQASATYALSEPEGCHVSPSRELLIRDPSVVDDPQRTAANGAWSFGHLLEQVAKTPADAPDMTEAMFRSFTTPQTINGFDVDSRSLMEPSVLKPWPRSEDGKLDLAHAPMRLLAIAHRLDLAELARGQAGEGRFVYGVLGRDGSSLLFTVILEYLLPAKTESALRDWALVVHALQAIPFPSDAYNAALQALTERYTARDALPASPNGSTLLRIRTNENALGRDGVWEMREFHLSPNTGLLEPAPLAQTPDVSFNDSARLAQFIQANQASIEREKHDVPAILDGAPFQAGALFNKLDYWQSSGASPELRHKFSLNTCDGCHGGETASSFFHVFPRNPGTQSQLSTFLTGAVGRDPATGESQTYNELARRRQLLEVIVCAKPAP